MTLVDWEAVVLDLEKHIEDKPGRSFGERELTDLLRRLRVRHRIPEGMTEKALRMLGPELIDLLSHRPAAPDPEASGGMDEGSSHRIAAQPHEGEHSGNRSNGHRVRVA